MIIVLLLSKNVKIFSSKTSLLNSVLEMLHTKASFDERFREKVSEKLPFDRKVGIKIGNL